MPGAASGQDAVAPALPEPRHEAADRMAHDDLTLMILRAAYSALRVEDWVTGNGKKGIKKGKQNSAPGFLFLLRIFFFFKVKLFEILPQHVYSLFFVHIVFRDVRHFTFSRTVA